MESAGGYILKFTRERYEDFEYALSIDDYFPEAVPEFKFRRSLALVCFIVNADNEITHISNAYRGVRAGFERRRINCRNVFELSRAVPLDEVTARLPGGVQHWAQEIADNGGLLPPKSFEAFIDIFIDLAPDTRRVLAQYSRIRRERLRALTPKKRQNLAFQKEAVATAITIAGLDRDTLQNWSLERDRTPESFLDNLSEVRVREDPMVIHDMQVVPGFDYIKSLPYGAAVFEDGDRRLTVIMANRQPLEEQTGTDLIYYHEHYKAFVMVQYKAMEHENGKAVFRPNKQFQNEVARMERLRSQLDNLEAGSGRDGYRLNPDPFYLKFCPRLVFNPDSTDLVRGMYMPLDYWKLCEVDPALKGPKGGTVLTFANADRYFDNTLFIRLVTQGWIGSSLKNPRILEQAIRDTIESGRAIAIAIDRDDDADDDEFEPVFVTDPELDGLTLETEEKTIEIEQF